MTADFAPRLATEADFDALGRLISSAFLSDLQDGDLEQHRLVFEPDRTHVVVDDEPVATGAVRTRDMTVPGAVVPAAHVTGVAVASTHRRRGLLTSIMTAQLEAISQRADEPFAVLWASEGAIYGRYGYGPASWSVAYEVNVRETTISGVVPDGARLRTTPSADSVATMSEVYERVRPQIPGLSSRPGRWWEHLTGDRPSSRRGMTAERAVTFELDGRVDGYARFRTKAGWGSAGPSGEVKVIEVVAATPAAHAGLWRYLLSIDLARTVRYQFGAVDDPLPYIVTNPEGLDGSISPTLWVRIVDVPAALAARRYAVPIDVVIEVRDDRLGSNGGRWRLIGDVTSASCEATDTAPDLSLDVRELGSIYLGGVTLTTLEAAGLITEHTPGAVASAAPAFGWRRTPAAIEVF